MSLFSEIENAINNRVNLFIDKIVDKYGINNNELNSLWKEIYEGKNMNQKPKPQEPKPQEPKPQEPKPQEPKRGNKKEKTPDVYCTYIITRGPKKGNPCNSKCRKGPYCSKHKSKLKTKEPEVIEDESKDEKDEKDESQSGESQSGEFDTDDIINEMSQHKTIHLSPICKLSSSDENKKLVDSYEKSISSNDMDNELDLVFKNLTSKDPTESDVIDILSEIQE